MFSHVILGLLRDGEHRHGYELITHYRLRSGNRISPGNFYRELTRMAAVGLVQTGVNPPGADTRRIPYQITERGRCQFDRWLVAPSREDEDIAGWLLFVGRVPREARDRILQRYREDLWVKNKMLTRAREDALRAEAEQPPGPGYDPLPIILSRQMKQVSAELDFLDEFREYLEALDAREQRAAEEEKPAAAVPSAAARQRRKGAPSR
jgi:DNA-binding PadR family transcriptional regulator